MDDIDPNLAPVADRRDTPADRASHLAFVAHEIRNPLATALWSAELLGRLSAEERAGARGDKLSKMCLRAISRVRRLAEDHLLAERLDVGGVPVTLDAVALVELVPLDATSVGASALSVDVERGLVVVTDAQLTRRAIEALLFAAARGNSEVKVTAGREGPLARLRVEGTPASPADLADRRRGDTNDGGGSPLGLGVARRVAAAVKGSLGVEGGAFVLELRALEVEP